MGKADFIFEVMQESFCRTILVLNTPTAVRPEELIMKKTLLCPVLFLAFVACGTLPVAAQNEPDFSLAVSPASVSLPQAAVTSVLLTFESNESPAYTISLNGLPEGVQAQTSKIRAGAGTVSLYAAPEAAVGTYAIQVTAHAGKASRMQVFTLNVKPMVPVPQWEYTVLSANTDEEFVSLANNLGAQGWEMVNVRFSELTTPPFVGFFKRIKR